MHDQLPPKEQYEHRTARANSWTALFGALAAALTLVAGILGFQSHERSQQKEQAQSQVSDQAQLIERLQEQIDELKKTGAVMDTQSSGGEVVPTTSANSPASILGPKYLVDLNPTIGDSVQTGLAKIAGKIYRKSFMAKLCLGAGSGSIEVVVPPGMTTLKGVVGYEDNSFGKSDTGVSDPLKGMLIETTTDLPSLESNQRQWVKLDELALKGGGRSVTPFTETLPPNTTVVRLGPHGYACSTTVAWGDPVLS